MSENHGSDLETNGEFTPPRHWLGAEELQASYWNDPAIREKRAQEFHDKPIETLELIERLDTKGIKRRDFLTLMGASMAMASFACARRPVHKIIPYVVKPEEVTGGIANYYATTCPETGYGLLAKVREGRPIKLEGNPEHGISRGAISGRTQAQVLDLYDMDRAKEPLKVSRGKGSSPIKWEDADSALAAKLKAIAAGSGRVRILSNRILGDSTLKLTNEFLSAFSGGAHIQLDDFATSDLVEGQVESYGTAVVPHYHFEKAEVVLSLGGDFLGTWPSSVEYAADWVKGGRIPDPKNPKKARMSKLFVVESMMSVTGANSDVRFPVRPDGVLKIGAAVAAEVARKKGISVPAQFAAYSVSAVSGDTGIESAKILEAAQALLEAGAGKSIIVAGGLSSKTEDALGLQVIANYLNSILGNEGVTVDGTGQAWTKLGDRPDKLAKLIRDMNSGSVDALIVVDANPVYSLPAAMGFATAMTKVPTIVSIGDREDETARLADYLLPNHHFLENWGDAQPRGGVVSLQQPTLAPIHSTRAYQDTLLAWIKQGGLKAKGLATVIANAPKTESAADPGNTWHDYLKANWKATYGKGGDFETFWEDSLRDGVLKVSAKSASTRSFKVPSLAKVPPFKAPPPGFVLALYAKTSMADGNRANNPWLQELPDPITTATWDNYINISPKAAAKLMILQDDVISLTASDGKTVALSANIQAGLHENVVTMAIGYGRESVGKIGNGVGRDVKHFVNASTLAFSGQPVKVAKTGRRYQIGVTQWHNATENRPVLNDVTLAEYQANPKAALETVPELRLGTVPTMWPKHKYTSYRWGMTIDLNACTGCGSCIIACQAENNIPTVGRDNVRRSREMHWMRIDRYYSGSPENPDVVFQPMLCQHCENAPCETVCPVLATVHDDEGLNVQVYNRCVGTRYCQNNCPYKVRRFNFFDHWKAYEGTMNLVWNPDVTVRTRGIMEKCTFCVQRIRDAKDKAKDEGRKLKDLEFKTACQQTCSTDAIIFGDINDPKTEVSTLRSEQRAFRALEVLNTVPSISYLSKVRNKAGEAKEGKEAGEHHV
jgi:molybdopterin-containing oxidoreductase family iron-sulfur binding subunit